jgi:hypothetical protein
MLEIGKPAVGFSVVVLLDKCQGILNANIFSGMLLVKEPAILEKI